MTVSFSLNEIIFLLALVVGGEALTYEMAGTSILTRHTLEWVQEKGLCSSPTVSALTSLGIEQLTTIQLLALPKLLAKSDIFIHARTGSGKTLAFLVPAIERLRAMKFKKSNGVGALIISPTRELSQQISAVLQPLAEAHGFSHLTLTGGAKSKYSLVNKDSVLVVGTPGKILKALTETDSGCLPLHNLKILILDEADRLLDKGSLTQQLREILSHIPKDKFQKILVSATLTEKSAKLAKDLLNTDFALISSEKRAAPTTAQIKQNYLQVGAGDRISMLVTVLQTLRKKKVIVFFNSCHSVTFHHRVLADFQLPVYHCMGQEKQERRSNMYAKFVKLNHGTLLTTGMAERGWDIPGVHWIIQYDPPHKPEDYIHRIGRTGRGEGQAGQALLFLQPQEEKFVQVLKNMDVKIGEIEFGGDLKHIQDQVYKFVGDDIAVQQMGKVAFKKFVRAYQCHKLKKIFHFHSLNLKDVCKAFGFIKPPLNLGHLT